MAKTNGGYVAGKAPMKPVTDEQTRIIAGPFWTRRKARKLQREIQGMLDVWGESGPRRTTDYQLAIPGVGTVPTWARGVRVERMGDRHFGKWIGRVTWALVATSHVGH